MQPMNAPQSGIFALGTASHAYLEFDALDQGKASGLVRAVAEALVRIGHEPHRVRTERFGPTGG